MRLVKTRLYNDTFLTGLWRVYESILGKARSTSLYLIEGFACLIALEKAFRPVKDALKVGLL